MDLVDRFNITEEDKVLGLSSQSFDLSVFIFGMLGAGGTLVLSTADVSLGGKPQKVNQIQNYGLN